MLWATEHKTAIGKLTPDFGGGRISGWTERGDARRIIGRPRSMRRWHLRRRLLVAGIQKGSGYLIFCESAVAHEVIDKKHGLIKLCEESRGYNFNLGMSVKGTGSDVTVSSGVWKACQDHAWSAGALAAGSGTFEGRSDEDVARAA